MDAAPGTYVLILKCARERSINIGKLGRYPVVPGTYAYVGSAFGPGGLLARIRRHIRKNKKKHWHIDYLRPYTMPVAVWYSLDNRRHECAFAACLQENGGRISIPGFGSTDCRCNSHLFYFQKIPDWTGFSGSARKLFKHSLPLQRDSAKI